MSNLDLSVSFRVPLFLIKEAPLRIRFERLNPLKMNSCLEFRGTAGRGNDSNEQNRSRREHGRAPIFMARELRESSKPQGTESEKYSYRSRREADKL